MAAPTSPSPTNHSASDHILTIFSSSHVYNLIFSCFDFAELVRISQTCRLVKTAVSSFCGHAYDIHKHLSHYFDDPAGFRNLQVRTTAIICDSNVLQFFERTSYPDTALDIFVQDIYAKEFGNWVVEEGYEFVPTQEQCDGKEAMFDNVEKFKEREKVADPEWWMSKESARYAEDHRKIVSVSTFKKGKNTVQLVCTRNTPMHCLLAQCTCVLNYITHEGTYHLYPRATFIQRIGAELKQLMDDEDTKVLEKYEQRGCEIIMTNDDLPRKEL
ncbi:hypothetical protein BDQ17DRAFT_1420612 [Cyathus striatus]|nr:hypothetical protein BDQ17DRAFT_1420612 [Cyathus striatus]